MASHGNLKRRSSGIYVVRLRVPKRFQALLGRAEVHHSTGVRDARQAKIAAAELSASWHTQLLTLERMDPSKIVRGSLALLGTGFMPLDKACELLGTDRRQLMQELLSRRRHAHVHAQDWIGWEVDDVQALDLHYETGFETDVSESALEEHGRKRTLSRHVAIRFSDEALSVATSPRPVEVCVFLTPPSRTAGFVVPIPGRALSADQLLVRTEDVEAIRLAFAALMSPEMLSRAVGERSDSTTAHPGHASSKQASMRVSQLTRKYLERQGPSWTASTLQENSSRAEILVELTNDSLVKEVDRDLLWRVIDELKGAPARRDLLRHRFPELGPGIRPLIARAAELNLPKVSPTTLEKLARGFTEILSWGVVQGYLPSNPAKKLSEEVFKNSGGIRTRDDEEREPLSKEDLDQIFSRDWFKDGVGKRTAKGEFYAYRPHYYWLPLLALYSGGRLNELSQLYLRDFVSAGDTPTYIDFNLTGEDKVDADRNDKSLKTANSQRRVPLHPRLIELGLLAYVEALRSHGHVRLFPELTHDTVKGYGKASGKWFNERLMGRELGIRRDGKKTFHSFRHNFSTALGDLGVPSAIKSQLLGHSRGPTETERRYDKGRDISQLFDYLAPLQYSLPEIKPFNVDSGLEALTYALALKKSKTPALRD